MNSFLEQVTLINNKVNGFVWGPSMLLLIIFAGIFFSCRTGLFQLVHFNLWMDKTFLAIFKNKKVRKASGAHSISEFQALSTALAGTIGTGNIAGVATALVSGGPGAIFWMWLSAFFGMMTNYSENVLGIHYRYKNEKGAWMGGPMVYLERGLHQKWLAVLFSCFCILASFGIGNMTQANSIAEALNGSFGIPKLTTGIVLAILVGLVILGGIKRIGKVTERIVPFMALFYIIGGIVLICANFDFVPAALKLIFTHAFNFKSVGGGILGYGIARALRFGVARGVFSNEAGLGSSVMVHSASSVQEPVVQGMWGIFEVFADTIIVCTITALCVLTSALKFDLFSIDAYGQITSSLSGSNLVSAAFDTLTPLGGSFVSIAVMLFAFSTLLGWSFYGERGIEYLIGVHFIIVYKFIFLLAIIAGCTMQLDLVWNLSDTFNGLMALPNLIGILFLSNQVVSITKDYIKRYHANELKEIHDGDPETLETSINC